MSRVAKSFVPDRDASAPGLAPDTLFELRHVRDARLSPDGRHAAYVMSHTAGERERFEIYVADFEHGGVQRLPFSGNAVRPRWSPDGNWLAFVGDTRLHIASMALQTVEEPLTPDDVCVQGAPSWSPDSTQLAVSLLDRPRTQGPRRISNKHFRAEGVGFIDNLAQRIFVVNRSTRTVKCVTNSAPRICSQPEWSPCGRRILFFADETAVPISSYSPRLMLVEVGSGATTTVLGPSWYITAARWLPCGERIVVSAARDSTLTIPNPALWVVECSGVAVLRTPTLNGKIGGMIHDDIGASDLPRNNPITVIDHQSVLATVVTRGRLEVWRVALEGPIDLQPVLHEEQSCICLDAKRDGNILLYAVTDLRLPTELWRAQLDGGRREQLTRLNDQVVSLWPVVRVQQFTCTSADGLTFDAWFMARSDLAFPLPTIMFIHGGPFASTGQAFRYDFHSLASAGFGVLFANFRGSAGYGDAFTRAIMGNWGARGFPDHMAAVDTAIARGLADPERLGVWGTSHGGFATCWIVGHTSRFKAAVAEAAITNFTTLYYLTDAPEVFARDLGGRPHEIPDVYRACSPITYAHSCTTPTLLLHGEADLRCPITEAEQFYRVLHDIGCTTELLRLPECNHSGEACGPSSARRARNEALLAWFQKYL